MTIRLTIHITTALFIICIPTIGKTQDAVPKTTEEARRKFEAADAELNKIYLQCWAGETVQSQATLQKAQRMWVEYRDLNAAAFQTGESSRRRINDEYYFYARTILTQSRIKELKALFYLSPFNADGIRRKGIDP